MSGVGDSHHSRSPQLQALLDEIADRASGVGGTPPGDLAPIAGSGPVGTAPAHDAAPDLTPAAPFDDASCDTIELAVYDPQYNRSPAATALHGARRRHTRWVIALASGVAATIVAIVAVVAITVGNSSRATPAPADGHQPPVGFVRTAPATGADGLTRQVRVRSTSVISLTTRSRTWTVAGPTSAARPTPVGVGTAPGVPEAPGVPAASPVPVAAVAPEATGPAGPTGRSGWVPTPARVDRGSTSANGGESTSSSTPVSGQLATSSPAPVAADTGASSGASSGATTSIGAAVESTTSGCVALIQPPIPAAGGLLPPVLTMPCP